MQKLKLGVLILAVVVTISMMSTGCSLVTVNPEKDNEQILATIDGQDIQKSMYNNYMAYYTLFYTANGQTVATDGLEYETLKKTNLDALMQTEIMAAKAKKDALEIDEDEATSGSEDVLSNLKDSVSDGTYTATLTQYNSDEDAFTAFVSQYMVDSAYATAEQEKHDKAMDKDPSSYTDSQVGTINGDVVKRSTYDYYYIFEQLNNYMTTGEAMATDDDTVDAMNERIFDSIAKNQAYIQYAEDNDIEIKDADVKTQKETIDDYLEMFGLTGDDLSSYLESYYLTLDSFSDLETEEAKAVVVQNALKAQYTEDAEVTDAEIQKYYEDNQATYDEEMVSAEHILTEDEDLANEIYEEAKNVTTKKAFTKIMDEYKGQDGVTDASDLGAFNNSKMVEAFSDQAFSQTVNTVSKPIKTDYGYHVIFVYDHTKADGTTWEDHKDEITNTLKANEADEEYTDFDEKLLKKQNIKIDEDIQTASEIYINDLKEELNVTINEKVI